MSTLRLVWAEQSYLVVRFVTRGRGARWGGFNAHLRACIGQAHGEIHPESSDPDASNGKD